MRERHLHSTCKVGKSRKRLSELMNSVQQFHSTRSRLDTNLLWNIIGELESFHNKDAIKRIQLLETRHHLGGSGDFVNFKCFPSKKTQAQDKRQNIISTKKIEILKKEQLNVIRPLLSKKEQVIDTVEPSSNSHGTTLKNGSKHKKEKIDIEKEGLSQSNLKTFRNKKHRSLYYGNDHIHFKSMVNNNQIINDDSKVKSLTNYWNTYLNNDMKNTDDRKVNNLVKVNRKTKIQPVPELCKNLCSNNKFEYLKGKLPSQTLPLKVVNNVLNNSSPFNKYGKNYSSYNTEFKSSSYYIKEKSKYFENRNSSVESELITDDAIQVLQRLMYTLSNFPETPILSHQVPLPTSVKTILCLLTTAMMKHQSQNIGTIYEVDLRKLYEGDVENKKQNNSKSSQKMIAIEYQPQLNKVKNSQINYLVPLYKNTTSSTQSNSVVAFHGICLNDVNNAIQYFDLLKDIFFMRFALISDTNNEYIIENEQSEETFTIIYERHIIFDETFVIDYDTLDLQDDQNEMHYLLEETLSIPKRIVGHICFIFMKEVENILATSINDFIKMLCQISTVCFFVWIAIIFLSMD